jgi:hypothetical protein
LISLELSWINTNISIRFTYFKQEFPELIVQRQDKCKQAIFLRLFGFMRGSEGVQRSGTERPRTQTGEAVRSGSLEVEDL